MITNRQITNVFRKVRAGHWIPRWELQAMVRRDTLLDPDDLEDHQPGFPKWHHQIDNALAFWKARKNIRFSHDHSHPCYYFTVGADWEISHHRTAREILDDEIAAMTDAERADFWKGLKAELDAERLMDLDHNSRKKGKK